MKKKGKVFKSILLCLVALGLSGCNDCKHTYSGWTVTKAATCTEAGTKERTCSKCGEKETGVINPLGHNFVDGVCTECGAHEQQ